MNEKNLNIITLKEFQFNEEILILEPTTINTKKHTLVIEKNTEYLVFASARRIINKCCATFGTSLTEARTLSKRITRAHNKLPICLGTTAQPFVIFPTLSPSKEYTIWIAYSAITWYQPSATMDCDITLKNNSSFTTNISTSSLQTQIARSTIIHRHYESLNRMPSKQKGNT